MAISKPSLADVENTILWYIVDIQFIAVIKNMLRDELGTEFCWPKEKRANIKSLFTPYWRLCLLKI